MHESLSALFHLPILLASLAVAAGAWAASASAAEVTVGYAMQSPRLRFGVERLTAALAETGDTGQPYDFAKRPAKVDVLVLAGAEQARAAGRADLAEMAARVAPDGFKIVVAGPDAASRLTVLARDETGAMYGLLNAAEQVRMSGGKGLAAVSPREAAPKLAFRAIKFNLPWSPYRTGAAMDVNVETCRDLTFWQRFLDMMAENRFNALTLWNVHPFPWLVRAKDFPEACPLTDAELAGWQKFWKALFAMAKDRGIETYIVNWNIVVPPEFAKAHGVKERNDTAEIIRRYTRQCITQTIDEYPDLTGLGITLADWMDGMTPKERGDWTLDTFVAGIKDAKRPIKFIYRSVRTSSPPEARRVIDALGLPDPVWMEIKFNWSHALSTPRLAITHDSDTGQVDDGFWNPPPKNYRIAWMIRNEDVFILRWGDPEFIRAHLAANTPAYVGGYFVGSESFIPAADTSHEAGGHRTWQYAFEKQWLLWRLWGRLFYDPATPDAVLAAPFDQRYGRGMGEPMLKAYTLAGRMPERLASFYAATWDFTLYSEGFLSPVPVRGLDDKRSPFISINEFIQHETLDPAYVSIPDYVRKKIASEAMPKDAVTPVQLADDSERDARAVLESVGALRARPAGAAKPDAALECELLDLETWANLGLYLAEKLRAGVALETFRRTGAEPEKAGAVDHLTKAAACWRRAADIADSHLHESPNMPAGVFSWRRFVPEVDRDIDLAREAKPEVAKLADK